MIKFTNPTKLIAAVTIAGSLLTNAYLGFRVDSLESSLEKKISEASRAEQQRDSVIALSQTQASQIELLNLRQVESQERTDKLQHQLAESESNLAITIANMKEAIEHEDCANTLVPDGIDWMYGD